MAGNVNKEGKQKERQNCNGHGFGKFCDYDQVENECGHNSFLENNLPKKALRQGWFVIDRTKRKKKQVQSRTRSLARDTGVFNKCQQGLEVIERSLSSDQSQ